MPVVFVGGDGLNWVGSIRVDPNQSISERVEAARPNQTTKARTHACMQKHAYARTPGGAHLLREGRRVQQELQLDLLRVRQRRARLPAGSLRGGRPRAPAALGPLLALLERVLHLLHGAEQLPRQLQVPTCICTDIYTYSYACTYTAQIVRVCVSVFNKHIHTPHTLHPLPLRDGRNHARPPDGRQRRGHPVVFPSINAMGG